jgi:uncharacterized protein (TIGR03435 family)
MLDLIQTAWGISADKVIGGPAWLETDRFDIGAKLPSDPSPENLKAALQSLLAERFKLVVHNDTRPLQAYALTVGKKSQLKETDGSGESGCRNTTPPGGRGGGPATGPPPMVVFACHAETMEDFAKAMSAGLGMLSLALDGNPVIDQTGLKGAYDFELKVSRLRIGAAADGENVTVFDAVDKLGLKLQLAKIPQPVIVVDSAIQEPTENPSGITQTLPPAAPAQFEVADVKPSDPAGPRMMGISIQPGGRLTARGITLSRLIYQAWSLNLNGGNASDVLAGAPKWLDTEHFDIVAKMTTEPSASGAPANAPLDFDSAMLALRALLADRFKLATHFEDRPVPVYALVAVKPRLTKADPANRASCKMPNIMRALTGSGPGGKNSGETISCRNTTMAHLAELLQQASLDDVGHPVVDATGLDGGWDFTLNWTPAILGQLAESRARAESPGPAAGDATASDPNSGLTMAQALEKQLGLKLELQRRPMPVLVIDHVEQKPTDN